MRRPITGKSATATKPVVPAKLLLALAVGAMLIALQQPWSTALRGADGWLILAATLLAVAGAAVGLVGNLAAQLRSGLQRWLWLAQVPLAGVVLWHLVSGLVWQRGFAAGAGLALGGAVLAATAGVGPAALPKAIKLTGLGVVAVMLAVAAPVVLGLTGFIWPDLVVVIGFALLNLYLLWWLLIPILQFESRVAARVFPAGQLFPRTSLEQVVARAVTLTGVGALVALALVATGGGSGPVVPQVVDPGLAVLLLPALGAAALRVATSNWRKCAPALLNGALKQVALVTATAIGWYLVLQLSFGIALHGVGTAPIIWLVLAAGVPITGWLSQFGIVNLSQFGHTLGQWCRGALLRTDDGEAAGWAVADLPIIKEANPESWSGAHRWVGPPVHGSEFDLVGGSDADQTAFAEVAAPASSALSASSASPRSVERTENVPAFAAQPAANTKRPLTTAHLPLAVNNQAELNQIGDSNPALTESGRLVIPLARPKWTPQQAMDPTVHPGLLARIAAEAPHLRPQVARNPSARPELLNWLAELDDPDVNLALAQAKVH